MRRREFIALLGGAAVWPLAAFAQRGSEKRVGVLMNGVATNTVSQSFLAAFVQELRQLGWVEGQKLRIDIRWSASDAAIGRLYAAQLMGFQPDVILVASTANLIAMRQATTTVPIVFVQVSDPVAQGFIASVTKPGGNLTGFSAYEFSIGGKWLDLLKEVAPGLARVGVMFNPDTSPQSKFFMRSIEAAASSLGVQAIAAPVHAAADIEAAIASLAREPNGALILPTDTFTRGQKTIIELTDRHRLPAISWDPEFPKSGGLMSYSVTINTLDQYRRAASYVDRILNGAKPGDLPVQQADKFTLTVNLKTAKAFGTHCAASTSWPCRRGHRIAPAVTERGALAAVPRFGAMRTCGDRARGSLHQAHEAARPGRSGDKPVSKFAVIEGGGQGPPAESGAPDRIRTCDLCLRRAALYPAELRARSA